MSHTLHRRGSVESLKKDIVFLAMPAHGFNDRGVSNEEIAGKLKRFMELGIENGCFYIGNASTGNQDILGGQQAVLDSTVDGATVHCVFDDESKAVDMIRALKKADLGMSIVVSGLFDMLGECCKKGGVEPHTVEYSLGIWGNTGLLPEERIMEINTMCGHGMVSVYRIQNVIDRIKSGKISCEQGGRELGKTCTCGIFNWKRAAEILEKITADRAD